MKVALHLPKEACCAQVNGVFAGATSVHAITTGVSGDEGMAV